MKIGPKVLGSKDVVFSVDAGNKKSYSGSGTNLRNKAGRGTSGTLENGATFNSTALGCMDFDGTNDFASIDIDTTVFNFGRPFTISCWFYIDSLVDSAGGRLWDKSDVTAISKIQFEENTDSGFALKVERTGNKNVLVPALDGQESDIEGQAVITGQWNHITVVYDESSVKMALNGASYSSGSHSGRLSNIRTSNNLTIGNVLRGTRPLDGKVSNLQIYKKVLSIRENTSNYNVTKNRYR